MDAELWRRAREVFDELLDLPDDRRDDLCRERCGGDHALFQLVSDLLAAGRRPNPIDDCIAPPLHAAARQVRLEPGVLLAHYRLEHEIGAGGMGQVWVALDERLERRVALKTLRSGFASSELLRRFEYETELLARLQHPRIAQIYEAGVWGEPPWPFFAMEFVEDARPLDAFARDEELSLHERLEIFLQACDAVEAGHQRGVVHRDLKPSNLLVGRDGQVKVIDFGVARATDSGDAVVTQLTRTGEIVGTLRTMSPEQLRGEEVDTRTDVYALGIVLFEILTDQPALDLGSLSLPKAIREAEAREVPAPSRVRPELPAELDWIVRQATEKAREQRYASVIELGTDIRRFRSHEPLSVGPVGSAYRLRKFVRRNRLMVGAFVAIFLSLIAGTIFASFGMLRARRAQAALEVEAEKLRGTNDFLSSMLGSISPVQEGRDARVADVLDRMANEMVSAYDDQPEVLASLHGVVGRGYRSLGLNDEADTVLTRGVEIASSDLPADHAGLLALRVQQASQGILVGRADEARAATEELVALTTRWLGPDHQTTLSARRYLAESLARVGERTEARDEALACLTRAQEVLGVGNGDTLDMALTVATILVDVEELEEAEEVLLEAIEQSQRAFGKEHVRTLTLRQTLVQVYTAARELARAAETQKELLAALESVYGGDHHLLADAWNDYGVNRFHQGELEEADEAFTVAVEMMERIGARGSREFLTYRFNRASLYSRTDPERAAEEYAGLVEDAVAQLGEAHPDVAFYLGNLAQVQMRTGEHETALATAERSLAIAGEDATQASAVARFTRAQALSRSGRDSAADTAFRELIDLGRRDFLGGGHQLVVFVREYARHLESLGRREDERSLWNETLDLLVEKVGPESANVRAAEERLRELDAR